MDSTHCHRTRHGNLQVDQFRIVAGFESRGCRQIEPPPEVSEIRGKAEAKSAPFFSLRFTNANSARIAAESALSWQAWKAGPANSSKEKVAAQNFGCMPKKTARRRKWRACAQPRKATRNEIILRRRRQMNGAENRASPRKRCPPSYGVKNALARISREDWRRASVARIKQLDPPPPRAQESAPQANSRRKRGL